MANIKLLEVASQGTPGVSGTPVIMDGSYKTIHVQATDYGTDGKIVLKESPNVDGAVFTTMRDKNSVSGLAEYSTDDQVTFDRLPQGWFIRADIVITTGTMTGALVVMGG